MGKDLPGHLGLLMKVLVFSLFLCTAFACWSKYCAEPLLDIHQRNVPQVLPQVKDADRKIRSRQLHLSKAVEKFKTVFPGDYDMAFLGITKTMAFAERRGRWMYWVAITSYGEYEIYLEYLRSRELANELIEAQANINLDVLLGAVIRCFYNHLLRSITGDNEVQAFGTLLNIHMIFLKMIFSCAIKKEYSNTLISQFTPNEVAFIPNISVIHMQVIVSMLKVVDPENTSPEPLPAHYEICPLPNFISIYVKLKRTPLLTCENIKVPFEEILSGLNNMMETNEAIKLEFAEKLRQAIKTRIDAQFQDIKRESGDFVLRPEQQKQRLLIQTAEAIPNHVVTIEVPEPEPVNKATAVQAISVAIQLEKQEDVAAKVNVAASARQARTDRKAERQKRRHKKHLAALGAEHKDDKQVKFYYSAQNPAANTVFNCNKANDAGKRRYPAAKRFRHSIFPEITASGETINFLCNLMVSGTPDYEGFCAAHADLGGFLVEKKNGNKLFYFEKPIEYHKTLHRPHESSDFDHILYRRFYRNCGLHPYFFILDHEF